MIKIELTNASNGIIKRVIESQIDNSIYSETIKVYEFSEEDEIERFYQAVQFLSDISKDMSIDTGSDHSPIKLKFELDWGDRYNPTIDEVNDHLKELRSRIREWKEYKKIIEGKPNRTEN